MRILLFLLCCCFLPLRHGGGGASDGGCCFVCLFLRLYVFPCILAFTRLQVPTTAGHGDFVVLGCCICEFTIGVSCVRESDGECLLLGLGFEMRRCEWGRHLARSLILSEGFQVLDS